MTADRTTVARLPVSLHAWEIDVLEPPVTVAGEPLAGLLLVVEADTGFVRGAVPLEAGAALDAPLLASMVRPPAGTSPARPRVLHCRSESVRARVARATKRLGIEVRRVPTLPALDEAADSLLRALGGGPPPLPGIDDHVEAWQDVLAHLVEVGPWRVLDDGVRFRFEGGPRRLAGTVAVVIGRAGEQEGIVLFASDEAYERFCATGPGDHLGGVVAWCLHLERADDVDPDAARACAEAGLALAGGRYPLIFTLDGGQMVPMASEDQLRLLSAVQAVTALCHDDLEGVAEEPRSARVVTAGGEVVVRSTPSFAVDDDEVPLAFDYPHAVFFTQLEGSFAGERVNAPAVVLKLAKREAIRLGRQIEAATHVHVEVGPRAVTIHVGTGPDHLWPLARVDGVDDPRVRRAAAAPRLWLAISAGGATRASLRPRDFVLQSVLRSTGATPGPAPSPSVSDGPDGRWPKASETLLAFAEPVLPPGTETGFLEPALQLSIAVWNAVVMADHAGVPHLLDQVRHGAGAIPATAAWVEELVARKRRLFAGDGRLLQLDGVDERDGRPFVRVTARSPAP